ncbi:9050_t:CDS:2 [Cetraspora pellucida]|uniref:9050_t:CDS:1 n=1 Tax=Cetraspora pellucida TaxID=1433469 RepID=A0ACA9K861_9GLOM|nr:9050_t:CDS:2 [Cetraspora pellucida]
MGAQYFDEFHTHFWERFEDEFDRIHSLNTSNCRQNRDVENTTPAPSIEKVEHATDEAQNNNQSQDSFDYEVAVSDSNLTPDLLNLFLSQNESDAIMHKIGS